MLWNRDVGGCVSNFWLLEGIKGGMVLWRTYRGKTGGISGEMMTEIEMQH